MEEINQPVNRRLIQINSITLICPAYSSNASAHQRKLSEKVFVEKKEKNQLKTVVQRSKGKSKFLIAFCRMSNYIEKLSTKPC